MTKYKVIQSSNQYDLVDLRPTTGRTHQLRVHLKEIKHPIVGDTLYSTEKFERMFLHAFSIEITLPSKERMSFKAPLPTIFNTFLQNDA